MSHMCYRCLKSSNLETDIPYSANNYPVCVDCANRAYKFVEKIFGPIIKMDLTSAIALKDFHRVRGLV